MQKEMLFNNDIFCEFYKGYNKNIIVFFPGFPSMPITAEFIHQKLKIFMPRYPGTWESKSKFSHKNNISSMKNLCENIFSRFNKKLILLSCSYGSLVSLEISNEINDLIKMQIMVTPYLGWKLDLIKEKNKIEKFMKNVYRFEKSFDSFKQELLSGTTRSFSKETIVFLSDKDRELNKNFYDFLKSSNSKKYVRIKKIKGKHGYEANKNSLPFILELLK